MEHNPIQCMLFMYMNVERQTFWVSGKYVLGEDANFESMLPRA